MKADLLYLSALEPLCSTLTLCPYRERGALALRLADALIGLDCAMSDLQAGSASTLAESLKINPERS